FPYWKCPCSCTSDITKNKITKPPSASAMATERRRRCLASSRCCAKRSSSLSISRPKRQRRKVKRMLHDQRREQSEKINQRNQKQAARGGLFHFVALDQNGEGGKHEDAADERSTGHIKSAAETDGGRRETGEEHRQR